MAPWRAGALFSGLRDLLAKLVQTVSDRRVEHEVPDAEHDSTEDLRVDDAGQLDLVAGPLADPIPDATNRRFVELHRARHLDGQDLVGLVPQLFVAGADPED